MNQEIAMLNKNTVVYVDKKTNKQYDYLALGYIKEKKDANKSN